MQENKTTTLSALVAVSKTETGMDYVQVMPDDPRVGLVEPFHGMGYGQMLSNGSFDFIRKKKPRRKPEFKDDYLSLSFSPDGYDRVIFVVPSEMRAELPQILRKGIKAVIKYLIEKGYSL
jgi:hypothetical protein